MPAIMCLCNQRISIGEIPCPHEWLVVSDVIFDKRAIIDPNSDKDQSILDYSDMLHVIKCLNCERLAIFCEGYQNDPVFYKKEV
jgi:hypothetical protein